MSLFDMYHHHHHHHHHQVLLLLVEHMASMKCFQALRSPPVPLTSFRDLPVFLISSSSGFGGLEVACWPLIPKFAGSHAAKKILSTPSFGGEVKPSVPCRSFTACNRSLNVTWKSAFRQNSQTFLAHSSTFDRWVLSRGDTRRDVWWRKLECLTQIAQ